NQFERSRPAFCLFEQLPQIARRQVAAEATAEELRRFLDAELQLADVDLEQLAAYSQPAQPQAGLLAACDHELDGSRRVVDQPVDDLENLGLANELQVVQEQHGAVPQARQVGGQRLQKR